MKLNGVWMAALCASAVAFVAAPAGALPGC
jgi:hypothetical protein